MNHNSYHRPYARILAIAAMLALSSPIFGGTAEAQTRPTCPFHATSPLCKPPAQNEEHMTEATRIAPTVGRAVHLQLHPGQKQPMSAEIAYVHSDKLINVGYLDHNGNHDSLQSAYLWDGTGDKPPYPFCEWMPFQKGQAARTDNAERYNSVELNQMRIQLDSLMAMMTNPLVTIASGSLLNDCESLSNPLENMQQDEGTAYGLSAMSFRPSREEIIEDGRNLVPEFQMTAGDSKLASDTKSG